LSVRFDPHGPADFRHFRSPLTLTSLLFFPPKKDGGHVPSYGTVEADESSLTCPRAAVDAVYLRIGSFAVGCRIELVPEFTPSQLSLVKLFPEGTVLCYVFLTLSADPGMSFLPPPVQGIQSLPEISRSGRQALYPSPWLESQPFPALLAQMKPRRMAVIGRSVPSNLADEVEPPPVSMMLFSVARKFGRIFDSPYFVLHRKIFPLVSTRVNCLVPAAVLLITFERTHLCTVYELRVFTPADAKAAINTTAQPPPSFLYIFFSSVAPFFVTP